MQEEIRKKCVIEESHRASVTSEKHPNALVYLYIKNKTAEKIRNVKVLFILKDFRIRTCV